MVFMTELFTYKLEVPHLHKCAVLWVLPFDTCPFRVFPLSITSFYLGQAKLWFFNDFKIKITKRGVSYVTIDQTCWFLPLKILSQIWTNRKWYRCCLSLVFERDEFRSVGAWAKIVYGFSMGLIYLAENTKGDTDGSNIVIVIIVHPIISSPTRIFIFYKKKF